MPRLPRIALLLLAGLVLVPAARAEDGDGEPPNDPNKPLHIRVNQAIDSGVEYLLKQTYVAGNWSDEVRGSRLYDPDSKAPPFVHPTGCTSLSLYALLKSGVDKNDPRIKKGFDWLRGGSSASVKKGKKASNRIPGGTYELTVLILALEAKANPHKREKEREREVQFKLKRGEKLKLGVKLDPADEAWMKECVEALKKRLVKGTAWRYGLWTGTSFSNGVRGDQDMSATNLAMLALAAAERCGLEQPDSLYANVLKWTLSMQEKEGPEVVRWDPTLKEEDRAYGVGKDRARGFGYLGTDGSDEEHVPQGSMTACGLANIIICTSFLEARESPLLSGELALKAEQAWWDGVAWLDYHWTVDHNVNGSQGYHYYYLYCLERACDLKRVNLIAGHPWYNLGAQVLVDQQGPMGGWLKGDTHDPTDVLNTCFALLFLNRATPAITGD